MRHRAPRSTLFPYTTLFRSKSTVLLTPDSIRHMRSLNDRIIYLRNDIENMHQRIISLDRKSTRLNSSHLVISYAVFCLRKTPHFASRRDISRLPPPPPHPAH